MNFYLIGGIVSFLLSFLIHPFFIQFIVLAIFLLVLYKVDKNSHDVKRLKKLIEEHNNLMKKDIDELKRNG